MPWLFSVIYRVLYLRIISAILTVLKTYVYIYIYYYYMYNNKEHKLNNELGRKLETPSRFFGTSYYDVASLHAIETVDRVG